MAVLGSSLFGSWSVVARSVLWSVKESIFDIVLGRELRVGAVTEVEFSPFSPCFVI